MVNTKKFLLNIEFIRDLLYYCIAVIGGQSQSPDLKQILWRH